MTHLSVHHQVTDPKNIAAICTRVFYIFFQEFQSIWSYIQISEFIFINGVKKCSNFIHLHAPVRFSQYHLLFSTVYSCSLCSRLIDHKCIGLSLGLLPCYTDPYAFFCVCNHHTIFDYYSFVVQSEVRKSSFSRLFWLFEVFCVSKILNLFCSSSMKNAIGYSKETALKSVNCLGQYGHFNNICLCHLQFLSPASYGVQSIGLFSTMFLCSFMLQHVSVFHSC